MKKFYLTALLVAIFGQANAQFSQNFDGGTTTPAGWSVLNGGGPGTWVFGLPGDGTAHSGTNVASILYNSVAHDDYLVTPQITVAAGVNDRLTFWVRNRSTSYIEHYDVKVSTTGAVAANFTATLIPDAAAPAEWTKISADLTAYVGQAIYIGFHAVSTDQFELYLDDIANDAIPTCAAPTAGLSTVTSTTSVDLSWTSAAANAEVVVQPAGTGVPAAANDTGVNVAGTSYTATVSAQTNYEYYVRNECTLGTEFSDWSGPYLFTTYVLPGCSSPIFPADGAVDVPVGDVTFEWTAPTTGDPATSYDMYYGETADAVTNFVGNFEDTTALITIDGFSLTLYWRIVPINPAGEATGCDGTIWSFTTVAPPPPPANDECAGAIALTPAGNFALGAITSTNYGATRTETDLPSCQGNVGASVWYTVVVPASGSITIETQATADTTLTDTVIVAYTGTCGALTAAGCDDDGGPDGINANFSILPLTGLTAGSTLYVSVMRYNSTLQGGDFQVAAYDPSLLAVNNFDSAAFTAYPNPVKDVLNLSYDKNITGVAVYNLLGQEVLVKSVGDKNAKIDMSALNQGTYLVKVTSDNQVTTLKVVKQ